MKRLVVFLFITVFIAFIACNSDNLNNGSFDNKSELDTRNDFSWVNAGEKHNELLSIIHNNFDYPLKISNEEYVDSCLVLLKPFYNSEDTVYGFENLIKDPLLLTINKNFSKDLVDSILTILKQERYFTNEEINMVESLFNELNKDYNGYSNVQIAEHINNYSKTFINNIMNNRDNYPNDEILALLSVAEGSSKYWESAWNNNKFGGVTYWDDNDDDDVQYIWWLGTMYRDCTGYLVTWFATWASESASDNYKNDWDNSMRRVNIGLAGAAGASGF